MKIISGKYKGRILNGYDINGTRPTMDRVKESLFGMIQEYVPNSCVLDLYSGSGNLGIECLSNGASKAYLVDINKIAIDTISKNIKLLNINNANVIKSNAKDALNNFLNQNIKFNLIFLDPPYDTNELDKSLTFINNNTNLLEHDSLIICETTKDLDYNKYDNFIIYKCRDYKDKKITILKFI